MVLAYFYDILLDSPPIVIIDCVRYSVLFRGDTWHEAPLLIARFQIPVLASRSTLTLHLQCNRLGLRDDEIVSTTSNTTRA